MLKIPSISNVDKSVEYVNINQQKVSTEGSKSSIKEKKEKPLLKGVYEEISKDLEKDIISEINKKINRNTSAQFSYHEKTNRIMIKIVDSQTQEVIKEIPPEKTLDIISNIIDSVGLLVDNKV